MVPRDAFMVVARIRPARQQAPRSMNRLPRVTGPANAVMPFGSGIARSWRIPCRARRWRLFRTSSTRWRRGCAMIFHRALISMVETPRLTAWCAARSRSGTVRSDIRRGNSIRRPVVLQPVALPARASSPGDQNRARRRMHEELSKPRRTANKTPHIEPIGNEVFD
jgi:hypothetical protein